MRDSNKEYDSVRNKDRSVCWHKKIKKYPDLLSELAAGSICRHFFFKLVSAALLDNYSLWIFVISYRGRFSGLVCIDGCITRDLMP